MRRDATRDPRAAEQSAIQRERNRRLIRISRAQNGYYMTLGADPEPVIATSRAEMHRVVDRFFDDIESAPQAA